MKKSLLALACALVLLMTIPSSLAAEFATDTSIEANLTTWTWDTEGVDLEMSVIQQKYPGIKMEYAVVASEDYLKKVQTTVASGQKLPDIVNADGTWRGKLYNMGILENLEAEPYNFDRSTVFDYAVPYMINEQNEVVGIVKPGAPSGLAYSADVAEKWLGTSDPDELAAMLPDWDTFIKVGIEVFEKSGGTVYMFSGVEDVYQVICYQNDIPYYTEDNHLNLSDSVGPAIKRIAEMRDAGIVGNMAMWSSSWHDSYTRGNVIFYPCATWSIRWQLQTNDPEGNMNWRLMMPPEGGFNWGGGAGCLTKDSENKEAAWIVLREAGLSVETGIAYMNQLQWFSIYKAAFENTEISSYKFDYLGGQDIVDFYINDIAPTVKTRMIGSKDAAVEEGIALVVKEMANNPSLDYEAAMNMIAEEILLRVPELSE